MVRNLAIVWLLTGIWHGANWTFILWGMFFFVLQLLERLLDFDNRVHNTFLKHLYTLLIVNFQWVLFRADDIYQAGRFYLNMFGCNNNGILSATAFMFVREYLPVIILGILFATPVIPMMNKWFQCFCIQSRLITPKVRLLFSKLWRCQCRQIRLLRYQRSLYFRQQ